VALAGALAERGVRVLLVRRPGAGDAARLLARECDLPGVLDGLPEGSVVEVEEGMAGGSTGVVVGSKQWGWWGGDALMTGALSGLDGLVRLTKPEE
jgi:hypothetical protein